MKKDFQNTTRQDNKEENMFRVNFACNQNCFFCNTRNKQEETIETSKNLFIKQKGVLPLDFDNNRKISELKEFMQNDYENITFTGGEPTLNNKLTDFVALAKSKNIRQIKILSNAVRFSYPDYTKNLVSAGLNSALISLHSHIPEISDFLTQTPGSFTKTIRGIHNLINLGVSVEINTVINSINYRFLLEFVKFVHNEFGRTNINCLVFSFVQPNGAANKNQWIIPKLSEIAPYLNESAKYCKENGISFCNPFCGVPLCFFYQYKEYCVEYQITECKSNVDNAATQNIIDEKIKSPKCNSCKEKNRCFGVWRSYAKLYGVNELTPLT